MIPVATLDAAMLVAETAEMPLHNLGVLILEPAPGVDEDPYASMRRLLEARLHLVPAFRRRLVEGPLRLGDMRWIDDPRFDLGKHLLRATLSPPGGRAQLADFVGSYASRLLDRAKPLWEILLVDGLASGELAVVAKIHHATMDGLHLATMLGDLFDRPAEGAPERPDAWTPEREPGVMRLAAGSARALLRKPRKVIGAATDIAGGMLRSRRAREKTPRDARASARVAIPHTPWEGALTARRAVAFGDVSLATLREIGGRFGATVNDVVLAASAGALRRWLLAHEALPDRPLVANVPIAVKRAGEGEAGNQISMLRVHLPTEEPDPVARLERIRAETQRGKERHHASGSNVYRRLADLVLGMTVPAVLTRVVGFYSSHHGGDFHPALWNVVISNVPGPRHEPTYAGGRVTRIYPIGPVQHGSGLNLTVMSLGDTLCLGVLACPEKVPNLDDIATAFAEEVEILRQAR